MRAIVLVQRRRSEHDLCGISVPKAAAAGPRADWPATSSVPKLFVKAEPGAILASDAMVDFVRGWPAQAEVTVAGVHFLQEDSPDEIGRAIAGWMGALG
jgi:haloalkane dehalogenase